MVYEMVFAALHGAVSRADLVCLPICDIILGRNSIHPSKISSSLYVQSATGHVMQNMHYLASVNASPKNGMTYVFWCREPCAADLYVMQSGKVRTARLAFPAL